MAKRTLRQFIKAENSQASVIWNPKINKALARFPANGAPFETDSKGVAKTLINLGYKEVTPIEGPIEIEGATFESENDELKGNIVEAAEVAEVGDGVHD